MQVPPRWAEARPPQSVLFVEGEVPLGAVEAELERALPKTFDQSGKNDNASGSFHLERRPARLHAVARGLELALSAVGEVKMQVGPIACQGRDVGVEVTAEGRPSILGSELVLFAELHLRARVTGELRCLGVPVPLEPLLALPLELLSRGVEAAAKLARIPVDPLLRAGLAELAVPRPLALGGHDTCLDLAPSALVIAPLSGKGDQLRLALGVEVAPRLSLGACPKAEPFVPNSILAREESLGERFAVDVAMAVAHNDVAVRLQKALVGQSFGARGQSLVVRAAELGDAGGRVLVRLTVDGALAGELYLWGTPRVVLREGRFFLEVPDLQVAMETRSWVQRLKLALWELLDGGLATAVRSRVHLDVTDQVMKARAGILGSFDKPLGAGFTLRLSLDELRPAEVISRAGLLAVHVQLAGSATLRR